jgi:hypothetical protein
MARGSSCRRFIPQQVSPAPDRGTHRDSRTGINTTPTSPVRFSDSRHPFRQPDPGPGDVSEGAAPVRPESRSPSRLLVRPLAATPRGYPSDNRTGEPSPHLPSVSLPGAAFHSGSFRRSIASERPLRASGSSPTNGDHFLPAPLTRPIQTLHGVCCGDQRPAQLPRFGRRDGRGIGAVNDDLELSVPVRVLQPDDGYHDIGASPVVAAVLDSPLRAVECPEGCPDLVPTRHPATPHCSVTLGRLAWRATLPTKPTTRPPGSRRSVSSSPLSISRSLVKCCRNGDFYAEMIVMSRHLRTWNIAECRQEAAVCPTPPACTRATTSARRAEYPTRICVAAVCWLPIAIAGYM